MAGFFLAKTGFFSANADFLACFFLANAGSLLANGVLTKLKGKYKTVDK